MWPLENILAMNEGEDTRVKSDPVKAFLRRKALAKSAPRGQYYYESLDGRLKKMTSSGAKMFFDGMLPIIYEVWEGHDNGVKMTIGGDVHTIYWEDNE